VTAQPEVAPKRVISASAAMRQRRGFNPRWGSLLRRREGPRVSILTHAAWTGSPLFWKIRDEIIPSIWHPRRIKPQPSTALLSWRSVQRAALGGNFVPKLLSRNSRIHSGSKLKLRKLHQINFFTYGLSTNLNAVLADKAAGNN